MIFLRSASRSRSFSSLGLGLILVGLSFAGSALAQSEAQPEAAPAAAPAPTAKTTAAPAPKATTTAAPAPTAKTTAAPAPTAKTTAAPAPKATTTAAPAPTAKTTAAPAPQAVQTTAAPTNAAAPAPEKQTRALPPGHPPTGHPGMQHPGAGRPPARPPQAPPRGALPPPQLGMAFLGPELRVSALVSSSEFPYADENGDKHLNEQEITAHREQMIKDITERFSTLSILGETSDAGETGLVRVGIPPRGPAEGFPIIRFLLARKFAQEPKNLEVNYNFFEQYEGEVLGFLNIGPARGTFKLSNEESGFALDLEKFKAGQTEVEMLSQEEASSWWYPDTTKKKGFWFLGIGLVIAALFFGLGGSKQAEPLVSQD